MALADLGDGNKNDGGESNGQQSGGSKSMQLLDLAIDVLAHILIKQRQADEDEDQVRAEDPQRRLAEGEKRLNGHQAHQDRPQPIDHDREGDEVDHAQGTKLPFVELEAESRLREMRAEPTVANADE